LHPRTPLFREYEPTHPPRSCGCRRSGASASPRTSIATRNRTPRRSSSTRSTSRRASGTRLRRHEGRQAGRSDRPRLAGCRLHGPAGGRLLSLGQHLSDVISGAAECSAIGGIYMGDGTDCGTIVCCSWGGLLPGERRMLDSRSEGTAPPGVGPSTCMSTAPTSPVLPARAACRELTARRSPSPPGRAAWIPAHLSRRLTAAECTESGGSRWLELLPAGASAAPGSAHRKTTLVRQLGVKRRRCLWA